MSASREAGSGEAGRIECDDGGVEEPSDRLRVDRWLWVARLAKSRTLAADLVRGGHVQVNDQRVKPGREVGAGDRIELTLREVRRTVTVRGVAQRRGPASVAAQLYEESAESIAERERAAAERRLAASREPSGGARPTKRDRRRLDSVRRGRG
jgi:ribosome-associated heat shock protein Hsp15